MEKPEKGFVYTVKEQNAEKLEKYGLAIGDQYAYLSETRDGKEEVYVVKIVNGNPLIKQKKKFIWGS